MRARVYMVQGSDTEAMDGISPHDVTITVRAGMSREDALMAMAHAIGRFKEECPSQSFQWGKEG